MADLADRLTDSPQNEQESGEYLVYCPICYGSGGRTRAKDVYCLNGVGRLSRKPRALQRSQH